MKNKCATSIKILNDLYSIESIQYTFMTTHLNTIVDVIIYVRTDPEISLERIKKRGRFEELQIKLDYVKLIGKLYDRWLLHQRNKKIIVINGNFPTDKIMEELEKKIETIK